MTKKTIRFDHEIITYWVDPNDTVLDLGCGNGSLLKLLEFERSASGYGLEIDEQKIQACVENGVAVIEQNLDDAGLKNFDDQSFDKVVMSMALQAMTKPEHVLEEVLRVGKKAIITFPNFGHWSTRYYLFFRGLMPISKALPHTWYNTPNIHLCTVKDFEALCKKKGFVIQKRRVTDSQHRYNFWTKWFPNLMGELAFYCISQS